MPLGKKKARPAPTSTPFSPLHTQNFPFVRERIWQKCLERFGGGQGEGEDIERVRRGGVEGGKWKFCISSSSSGLDEDEEE